MPQIRLRPHHGLCIRFFEGKGYSNEFTMHMRNVIACLNDDTEILLADHDDVICEKCPNLKQGECVSRDKAAGYDRAVLERTGLSAGTALGYGEFQKKIAGSIIEPGIMKHICGDCGWADICHKNC